MLYLEHMRLIIAAGGGGHFASALAVIEALPKEWDVLVIGRKHTFEGDSTLSLEFQTAQKLGIPFTAITTGRVQRTVTRYSLLSLFKTPFGFAQSLKILNTYKPDIVVSFGGYVSVPVVVAASLLRIPIIIHEQTLQIGLANKVAVPMAEKICISWEASQQYFTQEKTVLTGNPLRHPALVQGNLPEEKLPILYITGGSAGSHSINSLVEGALEKLLQKYIVIHQTGDSREFNDFDKLTTLCSSLPIALQKRYLVYKFVSPGEMFFYLHKAELVIARSGMGTVTELLSLGKPCLLIPFPYGQHNEQLENAKLLVSTGLGEIADQDMLTSDTLYRKIEEMMQQIIMYKTHAASAKKLIHENAAQEIIEVISNVSEQKKTKKTE
jgi:UDP-N-acetylglucosamine--N-acetylmuramyl-(pentapeptide) pyrophosphoryl-undecaprenol N-acetylglucosamine transferase